MAGAPAAAQYSVVYAFGSSAGGWPPLGLVEDQNGDLFGNTLFSDGGSGSIFELANKSGGYTYSLVYNFCPGKNCDRPTGSLIADSSGAIYGVADNSVFQLAKKRGQWVLNTLYTFCQGADCPTGSDAFAGLTYQGQQSGALYDGTSPLFGTTYSGGNGAGVAYELAPENGTWTYQVIHAFCSARNCADGATTEAPLIEDSSGNLYGTTQAGGAADDGTAFELSFTGKKWKETVLHSFCAKKQCTDGSVPTAGLTLDPSGHLYGVTAQGGYLSCSIGAPYGCGVVFMLSNAGSSWQETVLHRFCRKTNCPDGAFPFDTPLVYTNGNLVGQAYNGGNSSRGGTLFELSGSKFRVLYTFCALSGCADGAGPTGPIVVNANGAIFGATYGDGGDDGRGVVYEFAPQHRVATERGRNR
jgi:uncharacterized repeat protein (TIGR03803 family)